MFARVTSLSFFPLASARPPLTRCLDCVRARAHGVSLDDGEIPRSDDKSEFEFDVAAAAAVVLHSMFTNVFVFQTRCPWK